MIAAALRSRPAPMVFGVATIIVAAAAIEGLIRAGAINRFVVPLPSEVMLSFARVVVEEDVAARFLTTFGEALMAGALVAAIGVPMGVLLYTFASVRKATESWVAGLAAAPIVLMYPLFLVIWGRSALTIIMMAAVSGLPAVILKTLEGLRGVRPVLINVGRSFKLGPAQLFSRILFPAAVPTIFVGLRLGMIFALINVVGVEFLINFGGLGQLINELAERYDLPGTYVATCFVILVSAIYVILLERIERWLRPAG
ncbi:MAG TPA: ABC transporter permease subunit [Bradyrhizobium sp.]|nr:ABC transporter permease subunit [Bradyrhizobium sp.]